MTLRLEYQGRLLTVREIAAKTGLSVSTVQRRRIGNRVMDDAEHAAMPPPEHPRAKRVFFRGESRTLPAWAKITGIPYFTLYARIHRYHWPVKHALTVPLNVGGFDTITFRGVTKTVSEWAAIAGITSDTLRLRLTRYGWTVERALTEPAIALADRNVIRRNRRIIERIVASFRTTGGYDKTSPLSPRTGVVPIVNHRHGNAVL